MKYNTHTKLLWLLMAASAVIRIVFFMQAKDLDVFAVPILDCSTYHEWALRLVAGDLDWNETYWMGPLYPHLLAAGYWLFGSGHQVVMAVQLLFSLINIWLVYRLGQNLLGGGARQNNRASEADYTALLAAFLYALYGAPVFYAGMKLMAVVVTTIMLLIALQAGHVVRQRSWKSWFVLGVLVGLGALARGNILIFLVGFPLLLWQRKTPLLTREHMTFVLAMWLGAFMMVMPATLRNVIVGNDLALLTSNGGVNLLIGQKSGYNGMFAPASDILEAENDPTMALQLESEAGHALKGSEISRILSKQAWELFVTDIDAMPAHYARKAYRFWNGYELPQIASYDYWRENIPVLRPLALPFMVFSALGLLGLLYLPARENQLARRIFLIIILGYFLSLMPFFPTARYRQPLVPLLAISAAVYLFKLVRMGLSNDPARMRSQTLTHMAMACLMVLAMHPIWTALDSSLVRWQVAMNAALRAAQLGDKSVVLQQGQRAEEIKPGMAWTSFMIAENLDGMEAWDEALVFYERCADINPDQRIIPYRMGRNREDAGQYIEALTAYGKALSLDPDWANPYMRSSIILRKIGNKEQALAAIGMAAIRAPGNYKIRSNHGSLLAENGQLAEAELMLQSLTVDFPGYVNGWFNLALVETQLGHQEAALQALSVAESTPDITDEEQSQVSKLRAVLSQ
jgi:tetratricopeptide (TPR) repeat protein